MDDTAARSIEGPVGAKVVGDRPADHPAGAGIGDAGEVEPALVGGHVGEVAEPELIEVVADEVPLHQVGERRGFGVLDRRVDLAAPTAALDALLGHEAGHPLVAHTTP